MRKNCFRLITQQIAPSLINVFHHNLQHRTTRCSFCLSFSPKVFYLLKLSSYKLDGARERDCVALLPYLHDLKFWKLGPISLVTLTIDVLSDHLWSLACISLISVYNVTRTKQLYSNTKTTHQTQSRSRVVVHISAIVTKELEPKLSESRPKAP